MRIRATSSGSVFAGTEECTTSITPPTEDKATGSRSRKVLIGRAGLSASAITMEEAVLCRMV
ncbi:hypothetical protein D3C71_1770220 [compost metagenome]